MCLVVLFLVLQVLLVSGEADIKHVVVFMLENRAFDHMLGYLHKINPEINGLTGKEFNRYDPFDPTSEAVRIAFDAPHQTYYDCGHTVPETENELWGSQKRVDPATMNGFVLNEYLRNDKDKQSAKIVMRAFNTTSLPVLSTLAQEFTLFDSFYSSLPGPTLPNRMYLLSGTSHGACANDPGPEIEGYPQRTFPEDVYDSGKDFGIYYGDFPIALGLSRLRDFPLHFHLMDDFYDDCAAGTLPAFSFIEPRWFDFLEWMENSQHPGEIEFIRSGDVRYGEMLMKQIYEALRASPVWNNTLLIITYDEHGGLYDHVPPPQHGVPNPDGLDCTDTPLDFTRLGIRIPFVLVSPWTQKGKVVHEPKTAHYDHTSVIGTVRKLLKLSKDKPLTKREAWAATFEDVFITDSEPRTDCPTLLPVPDAEMWRKFEEVESIPETEHNINQMLKTSNNPNKKKPLSDLQQQILNIAYGVGQGKPQEFNLKRESLSTITTTHEAALFVRAQMKKFLQSGEIE